MVKRSPRHAAKLRAETMYLQKQVCTNEGDTIPTPFIAGHVLVHLQLDLSNEGSEGGALRKKNEKKRRRERKAAARVANMQKSALRLCDALAPVHVCPYAMFMHRIEIVLVAPSCVTVERNAWILY